MAETFQEPTVDSTAIPSVENFQAKFGEITVHFQLVKLRRSCFLWIGDDRKRMECLSVAIPNPFEKVPLATSIIDRRPSDSMAARDEGLQIASKLSRKLNAQVFVTYNVATRPEFDVLTKVETHLFTLIKNGVTFTL